MSIIDQLEQHIAEFESRGGSIPKVESVDAMFDEYQQLAQEVELPAIGLTVYVLGLAMRGYMPVRLPDGKLGFIRYEKPAKSVARVQRLM